MGPIQLGVTRQNEMTSVCSGLVKVHHPDGGELFQYFQRSQAGVWGFARFFRVTWKQ